MLVQQQALLDRRSVRQWLDIYLLDILQSNFKPTLSTHKEQTVVSHTTNQQEPVIETTHLDSTKQAKIKQAVLDVGIDFEQVDTTIKPKASPSVSDNLTPAMKEALGDWLD